MQVSVGTLLAFTMVAISILILRYVPPDEVPLPSSLQESIESVSFHYSAQESNGEKVKEIVGTQNVSQHPQDGTSHTNKLEASVEHPLIAKEINQGNDEADIISFSSAFNILHFL